jgi:GT2 family glycosyltransferase/glycosyltransferase involved in cell wall biosynthesis
MRRLRVLFITDRFDAPYRYRCQQACEQLRASGAVANVVHIADAPVLPALARYGVLVLFRLPWSTRVEQLVLQARARGIPVLFDIDDLTFDPNLASLMTFRRRFSPEEWARTYGSQMAALRRTIEACDAFIGSTEELAEHAVRLGKAAFVHPNVVPEHYLRTGTVLSKGRNLLRPAPTIGYFSGSNTHDEDFASIAPALARVFEAVPAARLLVVGYLTLGGAHHDIESRTVRLPYMHWRDVALAYSACHVTIAPLAAVNAFTNGKSALKFFEAGALRTPVVATPVREMAAAIVHGETGFLANDTEEWFLGITAALDPKTSSAIGRAARLSVEKRHSAAAVEGRLFEILDRFAVAGQGPSPAATSLDAPDETGEARALKRMLRPGWAAKRFVDIVQAARTSPSVRVDSERIDSYLDSVQDGETARQDETLPGAFVLRHTDIEGWCKNDQVTSDAMLVGESRSRGADPHLVSPTLSLDPRKYRYLVLRLRVFAPSPGARAQLYWKREGDEFEERASISVTVATDGFDRCYVVDLADSPARMEWQKAKAIDQLRLDPMDRPGSFRVDALMLATKECIAGLGAKPAVDRSRFAVDFDPSTPLGKAVGSGRRLAIRSSGPKERVREDLFEAARAADVWIERLFLDRDGNVTATIVRAGIPVERGVDIVVPVFNARELTLKCLSSVLRHATGDYRLVVVDDKSTDPDMLPALRAVRDSHPKVVLLENPENLGFVGTANRGMRHAAGRDVILLNSDTEVFAGFRDRLEKAVYADPRSGMASPLSNNATICSVPEFCKDNALPSGFTKAEMAELVAAASEKARPTLVTPHGFCMYIRADFLEDVGYFDEKLFGRGFGEENDLGERAKEKGWRTILADDVYVWHQGKASFSAEGHALERKHGEVLERRHPGYHAAVALFIRDNPLASVHRTLNRHLRRRSHQVEPAPLLILHASPFTEACGGVEHCVRDLVGAMALPRLVIAFPEEGGLAVAEVFDGAIDDPIRYDIPLGSAPERFCHEHAEATRALEGCLELFRIGWVHVHHLMFLPLTFADALVQRGIPYIVTVHDFYSVCTSFNLLDFRRTTLCCPESCGDDARTEGCQKALSMTLGEPPPREPLRFLARHRALQTSVLRGARQVVFPSESTRRITSLAIDTGERTSVVPHGYDPPKDLPPRRAGSGPVKIAVLGQIAYASKGAEAYLATMALVAAGRQDVEWHTFGRTDLFGFDARLDALAPRVNVVRHGGYRRGDIVRDLREHGIDVGLMLPLAPETHSYTLTELLAAKVPVVAMRVGALEERLEATPYGVLVEDPAQAARELVRLCANRDLIERMASAIPDLPGTAPWAALHGQVYLECKAASPVQGTAPAAAAACRKLNAIARSTPLPAPAQPVSVTAPAPEIAATWWYRYANRAKPYAPESLRHFVRRRLSGDSSVAVARFRFAGPRARAGASVTLDRKYLRTALFTAHGNDPQFPLVSPPLDPRTITSLRFNMWCSTPGSVFAQLFWKHDAAHDFTEDNSIMIPLDGHGGTWQEYVARFDVSDRADAWYGGGPIVSMRFDPINAPGPFGLGELVLCGAPIRATGRAAR